jgi:hypothetical protein
MSIFVKHLKHTPGFLVLWLLANPLWYPVRIVNIPIRIIKIIRPFMSIVLLHTAYTFYYLFIINMLNKSIALMHEIGALVIIKLLCFLPTLFLISIEPKTPTLSSTDSVSFIDVLLEMDN